MACERVHGKPMLILLLFRQLKQVLGKMSGSFSRMGIAGQEFGFQFSGFGSHLRRASYLSVQFILVNEPMHLAGFVRIRRIGNSDEFRYDSNHQWSDTHS